MKTLSITSWLTAALLALAVCQPATAVVIADDYWGADNHGWGDRIGTSTFEIFSMDVALSGSTLTVSINTNFAGKGDDHLFNSITSNKGIGYGDLFLSSSWTPDGTAANHYVTDNNITGTKWTYGLSLDNRWWDGVSAGGNATLYSLTGASNNANALLSEDFLTGGTFRNGQEIAVDTGVADDLSNLAGWSITNGSSVNFSIDLTGTDLLTALSSGGEIGLHWGMTCANDTIEGGYSVPVPEPGIAVLLAAGLIGILSATRSKR